MQNKRNTGGSKALRVLAVIIGALMTLVGMLSASGDMDKILEGIGVGGGLLSFAKTMEELPVWNNTTLALVGLLLIGGVLNGIDVKKRDNAARAAALPCVSGSDLCRLLPRLPLPLRQGHIPVLLPLQDDEQVDMGGL